MAQGCCSWSLAVTRGSRRYSLRVAALAPEQLDGLGDSLAACSTSQAGRAGELRRLPPSGEPRGTPPPALPCLHTPRPQILSRA